MSGIAWGLGQYNQHTKTPHPFIPTNPTSVLKQSEDLVSIMLSESVFTIELTKAYRMASQSALQLKDFDTALEYAYDEAEVERNCLGSEIKDLRKLGVATECWVERVFEALRRERGEVVEGEYRGIVRRGKKKVRKMVWKKGGVERKGGQEW